jgi:hypothetical protein
MAKVKGVNICDECQTEYAWEYIVPQRLSSTSCLEVESIDEKCVHPKQMNGYNTSFFEFRCYCPKCDKLNCFSHNV